MVSISRWLRSEETDRPFKNCIICQRLLLEIGSQWLVNKEYHGGECVIEYAICVPCRDGVGKGIDAESKEVVRHFIENEIDWEARMKEFMMEADVAERFNSCICCLEPRQELQDFGICALYDADGDLTAGALPLLICKTCTTRMFFQLSVSSRDILKQFREHFLTGDSDNNLGFF